MTPLSDTVTNALLTTGTATISAQLFKRGIRSAVLQGLRPMSRSRSFVGRAITVRFVPAREDVSLTDLFADPTYPQRRVIEIAGPGDIVVFDCRGESGAAALGDILLTRLQKRGVSGVVADAGIRDSASVATMDFPVFALGPSPAMHIARLHAADLNVIIGCGGVQVRPGDVMLGDDDGVICIPSEIANSIAHDGLQQARLESFVLEKIRAGAILPGTYPPSQELIDEFHRMSTESDAHGRVD